jgi:hypothetical protein
MPQPVSLNSNTRRNRDGPGLIAREPIRQILRWSFNGQPSALGHDIAEIYREIHQHLIHHAHVGVDEQRRAVERDAAAIAKLM